MNNRHIFNYAKGITMLEILVTLIILSIGLLGMAALQITGVRGTNSASYRTHATLLAQGMVERIRANPSAVDNNVFLSTALNANTDCTDLPSPYCGEYYGASELVLAESCTSTEMAAFDLNVWFCGIPSQGNRKNGVQDSLPQASVSISCLDTDPPSGADADACTNRSPHLITVSWAELNPQNNQNSSTVTQTIAMTIQP